MTSVDLKRTALAAAIFIIAIFATGPLTAEQPSETADTSLPLVRYLTGSGVGLASSSDPLNIALTGAPDSSAFPGISAQVLVTDASAHSISGLAKSDFIIKEDGTAPSDFQLVPLPGPQVSVAFAIDRSGSMFGQPLDDAKQAAKDFINLMDPSDQVAITSYDWNWRIQIDQDFTSNRTLLNAAIDGLIVEGGQTAFFDGVAFAVDKVALQTGVKAVIAISDGDEENSTRFLHSTQGAHDLAAYATAKGIPVYIIGLGYVSTQAANWMNIISTESGGYYKHGATPADLAGIYQDIIKNILHFYKITYFTPNPMPDGTLRTLQVQVASSGNTAATSGVYVADLAPQIQRTPATVSLSGITQMSGTALTIEATIHDVVPITWAKLYYRTQGTPNFTSVNMVQGLDELWSGVIPSASVQPPGVDYYIEASNGKYTSTDPSTPQGVTLAQLGEYFYTIPVFTNNAPVITHSPVISSPINTPVIIQADIVDTTDNVAEAILFFKQRGSMAFMQQTLSNSGGNSYLGAISGAIVTPPGVDYYIKATDNYGVSSYAGSSTSPLRISVDDLPQNMAMRLVPATPGSSRGQLACLGYNAPSGDPITAVGSVFQIVPGGKDWPNFVAAAQAGVSYTIKTVELRKQPMSVFQCVDVFKTGPVVQAGTRNIRLWWPLIYEAPGTTWTLTIVYGTGSPYKGPNDKSPTYVHTEKWTWELTTDLTDIQNLVRALHTIPLATCEVPLISNEALYSDLLNKLDMANNSSDSAVQAALLSEIELMVADSAITNCPLNAASKGATTGIAQTVENPAVCAILVSVEYILRHQGVGQPSK